MDSLTNQEIFLKFQEYINKEQELREVWKLNELMNVIG